MGQFYAANVTGLLQRGEFPVNRHKGHTRPVILSECVVGVEGAPVSLAKVAYWRSSRANSG